MTNHEISKSERHNPHRNMKLFFFFCVFQGIIKSFLCSFKKILCMIKKRKIKKKKKIVFA